MGEKENAPANDIEKKKPKPKNSRKEEIAKSQAAQNAALRFYNANRPGDWCVCIKRKNSPSQGQLPHSASPLQPLPT